MNFYFCEKCGKRITDVDISQGAGKNKKLAGVFCSDCAVGVSTMETMPLTDKQARQIVQEEKKREAAAKAPVIPPRSTIRDSARKLTPAPPPHQPSLPKSPAKRSHSAAAGIMVAAVSVLLLIGYFLSGPSRNPGNTARKDPLPGAEKSSLKNDSSRPVAPELNPKHTAAPSIEPEKVNEDPLEKRAPDEIFLSTLKATKTVKYGTQPVRNRNRGSDKITVNGVIPLDALVVRPYPNGVSKVLFDLEKKYLKLSGSAASADGKTFVMAFKIKGDDKLLWEGNIDNATPSKSFDIDVSNVEHLELIVECQTDWSDACPVWLNPALKKKSM